MRSCLPSTAYMPRMTTDKNPDLKSVSSVPKTLDAYWRRCYFTDRSVGSPDKNHTFHPSGDSPRVLYPFGIVRGIMGMCRIQFLFARQTNS